MDGLPEECPQLTIIDVAHNQLTSLAGVSAFPALEDVWANTNKFVDLPAQLEELVKLPKLTTVYLHYNGYLKVPQPVEVAAFQPAGWSVHYPTPKEGLLAKGEYTAKVLEVLPRLEQLDDTYR